MTERWISVATAAAMLSVSTDFLRRECLAGRLAYVQLGPRLTRIAIEDVQAYAAARMVAGRRGEKSQRGKPVQAQRPLDGLSVVPRGAGSSEEPSGTTTPATAPRSS